MTIVIIGVVKGIEMQARRLPHQQATCPERLDVTVPREMRFLATLTLGTFSLTNKNCATRLRNRCGQSSIDVPQRTPMIVLCLSRVISSCVRLATPFDRAAGHTDC